MMIQNPYQHPTITYTRNNTPTIPDDNDCVIVTPPDKNENNDIQCIGVPPPDQNQTMAKPMSKPIKVSDNKLDYKSIRPSFGWLPTGTINQTFQLTT